MKGHSSKESYFQKSPLCLKFNYRQTQLIEDFPCKVLVVLWVYFLISWEFIQICTLPKQTNWCQSTMLLEHEWSQLKAVKLMANFSKVSCWNKVVSNVAVQKVQVRK